MLKCQKGNCFDSSTLLCSMLIGSGYDAYCVNGYGSLDLCLMDLTREVCPLTVKPKEVCLIHASPENAQSRGCPSISEDQGLALVICRDTGSHVGCPYTYRFLHHHHSSSVAPDPLFQILGDCSVLSTAHSPVLQKAVPLAML